MSTSNTINTDVLVLGAGPSGLFAANEAALAGASVLLVDATGELGGNAPFSSGYMAFACTSLQREHGIVDTPEAFLDDMILEVERKRELFNPELGIDVARRYAQESGAAFEYMVELGFRFGRLVSHPLLHRTDRRVTMLDRSQFHGIFSERFTTLEVTLMLRTRALGLVFAGGVVSGARLESSKGEQSEVHASSGVVVTTGGYQAGAEMRRRYQPNLDPNSPHMGLDTAVGDGQSMLEAQGGDLVNMNMVNELVQVASSLVEECIAVNEAGERFHDEAGPLDERVLALRRQPGAIAYFLCDARTAERRAQLLAEMPGRAKHLDSLGEVARAIGAPADALVETVQRWNATVEGGATVDPEFGRVVFPDPRIGIRTPPFTVTPMVVGTGVSGGGARVSTDMEVLRTDGSSIANVFAAGDCNGLINSALGLGGIHLGSAVTLGRVAGQSAAKS